MAIFGVLRLVVALLVLAAAPAFASPPPATVGRVAVSDGQGVTRVAIELTREVPYEIFLLDEPNRLVVSFASARWTGTAAGVVIAATGAAVSLPAIARRRPMPSARRIVFDLARPAKLRQASFTRARGAAGLLTLELEPISLDAFRALVRPWVPSRQAPAPIADAGAATLVAPPQPHPRSSPPCRRGPAVARRAAAGGRRPR
jgi:hypothetical protein